MQNTLMIHMESCDDFCRSILAIASGASTKNDTNNYCEISIFKDGVTL
jgi:altronate dehydratase